MGRSRTGRLRRKRSPDAEMVEALETDIARQVLDLHGGTILLDASPTFGGLRATVRLPAAD